MTDSRSIAICGIGCRFPGGVVDARSYWRLLIDGVDAITEIPRNRFDTDALFDPRPSTPGRMMTKWGGFLPHIDQFDASFFGISPREAERLDPQQRLLLETAWEALEDGGQDLERCGRDRAGVFVGVWLSDFENRLFRDPEAVDFEMTSGSGRYSCSGRVSYALGLRGPSLTIDTACSSSLVAVHLAVQSIRSGESSIALAGGANVILQPHIHIAYSQSRMMAPDGRCKFGDERGDGYVRSEGAAFVLLKPLDAALADRDRIYAVIRGSATNNDGRSSGSMGTPSVQGQRELLRRAYTDANVDPTQVGLIEAHGTGTRAGDPVELAAIGAVLCEDRPAGCPLHVGSVKTNIGHTEGAAGVAGLIKAALSLQNATLPPSLHCRRPTPAVEWDALQLRIPRAPQQWLQVASPRFAGVSAFGIAGTNAHVVLEEPPPTRPSSGTPTPPARIVLPLSARSPEALRSLAKLYAGLVRHSDTQQLLELCRAAASRRSALEYRAAFVAADAVGLADAIDDFCAGAPAAAEGAVHSTTRPRFAFIVPGQGGQWIGMAREMLAREPAFRSMLEQCDAAMRPHVDWSLLEQLALGPGDAGFRADQIDVIQPLLVAVALAYAHWLRECGLEPDAVAGHSMGEVAAACIAGVIPLPEAMRLICLRSSLMRRTSGQGAMALVELPIQELQSRLGPLAERVAVAVSNAPRSSVISGEPTAVQQLLATLESEGVFCRLVKVDVASHSPQMQALVPELVAGARAVQPRDGTVSIYSTVHGRRARGVEFDATYWGRNLREPVRFSDVVAAMLVDGITMFIELGPHPVLTSAVQQHAPAAASSGLVALACGHREQPEHLTALGTIAGLWAAGLAVDWRRVLGVSAGGMELPRHPWNRERYWIDLASPQLPGGRVTVRKGLDAAKREWLHVPRWEPIAAQRSSPASLEAGAWCLIADAQPLSDAIARALRAAGLQVRHATPEAVSGDLLNAEPSGRVLLLVPEGERAAYEVIRVARAMIEASAGSTWPARLWVVTRGAAAIAGDPVHTSADTARAIDHAAAWGAGRVVADEQPEMWAGLIDLDPHAGIEEQAAALVRELRGADDERQVALRGMQRFAPRLRPLELPERGAPFVWRKDAAYLITGGLGEIALKIAAAMVRNGARRLVLLGRSGLPPRSAWPAVPTDTRDGRRIAAIRELETAGASIHLLQADVGDRADLQRALHDYAAEGWPRIRGVLHAAGLTDNQLIEAMSIEAFDAVYRPKVNAARHLEELLPELDLFVLFSSISAVLGVAGMSNYVAANCGLDALATSRRIRGLPALSIQWGPWEGTGLHGGEDAESKMKPLRAQGIGSLDAAEAAAMFDALVGVEESLVTVMVADWQRLRAARRRRDGSLYPPRGAESRGEVEAEESLQVRLAASSPAERWALLEPVVRDAVGRILKIPPTRIDPRKPLGSMGLGSLLAMELRNRLESSVGRPLSATLAWNYPTIEALVAFLSTSGSDPESKLPGTAAVGAPSAREQGVPKLDLGAVQELSDEQAAMHMRRKK